VSRLEFRSQESEFQEFRISGGRRQNFRISEFQNFRSSGVQNFRSSGVE